MRTLLPPGGLAPGELTTLPTPMCLVFLARPGHGQPTLRLQLPALLTKLRTKLNVGVTL